MAVFAARVLSLHALILQLFNTSNCGAVSSRTKLECSLGHGLAAGLVVLYVEGAQRTIYRYLAMILDASCTGPALSSTFVVLQTEKETTK